jgi:hypothetical protein
MKNLPSFRQQSALLSFANIRASLGRQGGVTSRFFDADQMSVDPIATREQLGDVQYAPLLTRALDGHQQLFRRFGVDRA